MDNAEVLPTYPFRHRTTGGSMQPITTHDLTEILADCASPCISLYQPTHRSHPDNQQDPIRFRNLLKEAEASLHQKYPKREVWSLADKLQVLAGDAGFWNCQLDGLAVFRAPDKFRVFRLQRPVAELVVVAETFHTKPLLGTLQSADRYQVLCLSREAVRLYEGNRYVLDEVELQDVPRTLTEALGEELTESQLRFGSYGGAGGPHSAHGEPSMYHGHGSIKDEIDLDTERFFRAVDRAILEYYSRPSDLPLMLAALAEYHPIFRGVSHNPYLMDDGLQLNPFALTADRLREEAWRALEPRYRERLAKLVERFQAARARDLASDHIEQVAQATVAGRTDTLLVEADREVPGKVDHASGQIRFADLVHPDVDDILDDLAGMTLAMSGRVVVVPAEQMPSESGVAAIFRY
jgi:hypothetical protein